MRGQGGDFLNTFWTPQVGQGRLGLLLKDLRRLRVAEDEDGFGKNVPDGDCMIDEDEDGHSPS